MGMGTRCKTSPGFRAKNKETALVEMLKDKSCDSAEAAKPSQDKSSNDAIAGIVLVTVWVMLMGLGAIWLWKLIAASPSTSVLIFDPSLIFDAYGWFLWAVAWSGVIITIGLWVIPFALVAEAICETQPRHEKGSISGPVMVIVAGALGIVILTAIAGMSEPMVIAIGAGLASIPPFLADHVHWICGTAAFYVVLIPTILAAVAIAIVRAGGPSAPVQSHPLYEPILDVLPIDR
jgi:hypothetical protein